MHLQFVVSRKCWIGRRHGARLIGSSVDALALIQSARGWSGFQGARWLFGRWVGSKEGKHESPLPGQDCTRAGTPFALDEIVSMKWSGVLGAGTPPESMGAGRAKSPASGGSAVRSDGATRLNAEVGPMAWGMQRGRAAAPLPRLRVLPRTSCE